MLQISYDDILTGLIGSLIWAALTFLYFFLRRKRQNKYYDRFTNVVNSYFQHKDIRTKHKVQLIDIQIDEFRKELKQMYEKHHLNMVLLEKANGLINQHIHDTRVLFIEFLLEEYPDISSTINTIKSDGLVTQIELNNLLSEIENADYIKKKQKRILSERILTHCIKNNRVLEPSEFIREYHAKRPVFARENLYPLMPITGSALCIVALFFIVREGINNSAISNDNKSMAFNQDTLEFGIIRFKNELEFNPFVDAMSFHLNKEEAKPHIDFKMFDLNQFDLLVNEMNRLDGLILNPGTYIDLILRPSSKKQLTEDFELFAQHYIVKNGEERHYYSPVLVAPYDRFKTFCHSKNPNIDVDSILNQGLTDQFSPNGLVADYIKNLDSVSFPSQSSLSGYKLPSAFLSQKFGLDLIEQGAAISGDHSITIKLVNENSYGLGATYSEAIKDPLLKENGGNIVILSNLPEVPYNSYWINKKALKNNSLAVKIILDRFTDMNRFFDENSNDLHVDGWEASTFDAYNGAMQQCSEVIGYLTQKRSLICENKSERKGGGFNFIEAILNSDLKSSLAKTDLWELSINDLKSITYNVNITSKLNNRTGDYDTHIQFSRTPIDFDFQHKTFLYAREESKIKYADEIVIHSPPSSEIETARRISQIITDCLSPRGILNKNDDLFSARFNIPFSPNEPNNFKSELRIVVDDNHIELIPEGKYSLDASSNSITLDSGCKYANDTYVSKTLIYTKIIE